MTQTKVSIVAFFLFLTLAFLQLLNVFQLFLIPIFWAMILAVVFFPLYRWVLRVTKEKKNIAASLVTLLVILLTVGPMTYFSGTLVGEALDFYARVVGWLQVSSSKGPLEWFANTPLQGLWQQIEQKTALLHIEIVPLFVKLFERLTNGIVGQMQAGAKNFLVFVFDYLVTIFALFFFLRDGEALLKGLITLVPMSSENKTVVFEKMEQTLSAVVRGVGLTGITQGILAGLAFWILGIPYPLFLALLIAFLAFLPLGGAAMIWIPASLYLYWNDHWIKALILFSYGLLVISMVDNFLKPMLIGERTRLPTLFLFFSILGGIHVYGFIGVFLGPVTLVLFLTLIQIYRREYSGS